MCEIPAKPIIDLSIRRLEILMAGRGHFHDGSRAIAVGPRAWLPVVKGAKRRSMTHAEQSRRREPITQQTIEARFRIGACWRSIRIRLSSSVSFRRVRSLGD
jgi:hypothetical protein